MKIETITLDELKYVMNVSVYKTLKARQQEILWYSMSCFENKECPTNAFLSQNANAEIIHNYQ